MTFDSQQQKDEILGYVTDEKLREKILNAKIVEPWVPEHNAGAIT
jgi:hypothetical protein|tara:strand:- start:6 stop:140 length:135 start_codon:yes stop_codon:yes gene_type:complete